MRKRGWCARCFSALTPPRRSALAARHDHHHRSAVLPARHPGHHRARARQGRFCRRGHDLDAAARAHHAAAAGGRDPAADPAVPGRDLGLGLPPPMEPLEPQGAAPRRRRRRRHRLAVRGLCAQRLCGDRGRPHRRVLRALHLVRQGADASAPAERADGRCSGARLRASPRPSSRSAPRPTRSTSCRSGWTSSP